MCLAPPPPLIYAFARILLSYMPRLLYSLYSLRLCLCYPDQCYSNCFLRVYICRLWMLMILILGWHRCTQARFSVIGSQVAILTTIVAQWQGLRVGNGGRGVGNGRMCRGAVVGKDDLSRSSHRFNLADKDHMVAAGIFRYDARVDKGQCIFQNWCARSDSLVFSIAKMFIAVGGWRGKAA